MKQLLYVLTFDSSHRKCNFVVLISNSRYQNIEVGKSGRFGEEPILLFRIPNTDVQKGEVKVVELEINYLIFFTAQLSTPNVQSIVFKVEKSKMVR